MITPEDKDKLIATLTLQLQDKEKEIEKLKSENHALMSDNAYQEADIFELNSFKEYYKNNKISFCIEKFQETKKSLRDKVCLMENDEHCYPQNAIHWQDVVAIIDNQIASLKKGVV